MELKKPKVLLAMCQRDYPDYIKAALEYFSNTQPDVMNFFLKTSRVVEVDLVETYLDALNVLKEKGKKYYDLVIVSDKISAGEGDEPRQIGYAIAREANKLAIPAVEILEVELQCDSGRIVVRYHFGITFEQTFYKSTGPLPQAREFWQKLFETFINPFGKKCEACEAMYSLLKAIDPENPVRALVTLLRDKVLLKPYVDDSLVTINI